MSLTEETYVEEPVLDVPDAYEEELQYRPLSGMAAASVALGALSLLAILDWTLGVIPVLGMSLAGKAMFDIRRRPSELSGMLLARVGFSLSLVFLVLGYSYQGYVYATEVPPGYERIGWSMLQTPETDPGNAPPEAEAVEGKQIFIKGYMRPGAQQQNIKQFLLVRDSATCCFGPTLPVPGDMIQVTLPEGQSVDYSTGVYKVAGKLKIDWQASFGDHGLLYHLEADQVD